MENIQVCILVSAILIFIVIYVCIFSRVFHESFADEVCNPNNFLARSDDPGCSKFEKKEECNDATQYKVEMEENDNKVVGKLKSRHNCDWDSEDDECKTTDEECSPAEAPDADFHALVKHTQDDISQMYIDNRGEFKDTCKEWLEWDFDKSGDFEDYYHSKINENDRYVLERVCSKDWKGKVSL